MKFILFFISCILLLSCGESKQNLESQAGDSEVTSQETQAELLTITCDCWLNYLTGHSQTLPEPVKIEGKGENHKEAFKAAEKSCKELLPERFQKHLYVNCE